MTHVLFTLTPGARHGARPLQHGHAPALDRDSRPLRGRGARRRADARATHACRAPERGWPLRHAATYGDSGGPPCRRCLSLFIGKGRDSGVYCFLRFYFLHLPHLTPTHSSHCTLAAAEVVRVLVSDVTAASRAGPAGARGREEASQRKTFPGVLSRAYTVTTARYMFGKNTVNF